MRFLNAIQHFLVVSILPLFLVVHTLYALRVSIMRQTQHLQTGADDVYPCSCAAQATAAGAFDSQLSGSVSHRACSTLQPDLVGVL